MIVRSLRWKPLGAYSYFGALFAGGLTLGVVGVFISRNPAMAIWALFAAPLYCAAFFVVAELVGVAIVLLRRIVLRLSGGWRVLALAMPAALGGIAIGYVFWCSRQTRLARLRPIPHPRQPHRRRYEVHVAHERCVTQPHPRVINSGGAIPAAVSRHATQAGHSVARSNSV